MEDLFDVQTKHMDRIFKASNTIQADDLVSRAIYELSTTTYLVISAFQAERFSSVTVDKEKLKDRILASVEWVTALFYVLEIDPPEIEEVTDFAEKFDPEIAADAVLAALHIQRSTGDLALEYFCGDGAKGPFDEFDQYLGEILAGLELIARRLGTCLADLIMNI